MALSDCVVAPSGGMATDVDEVIGQIESLLPQTIGRKQRQSRVQHQALLMDTMPLFGIARDIMMLSLTDPDDMDRSQLLAVFGGNCVRIARMHAVLEAGASAFPFENVTANDQRLGQCLDACEAVESVLQSLGLGMRLRQALSEQRSVLLQRRGVQEEVSTELPVGLVLAQEDAFELDLMVPELGETEPLTPRDATSDDQKAQDDDDDGGMVVEALEPDQTKSTSPIVVPHVVDPLRAGPRLSWKVPPAMDPLRGSARGRGRTDLSDYVDKKGTAEPTRVDFRDSLGYSSLSLGSMQPPFASRGNEPCDPLGTETPHVRGSTSALTIDILSSRMAEKDVMWYSIKVRDHGTTWFLHKRYSDFKALDDSLQVLTWAGVVLPELPPPGLIGLRHRLNIGDFNARRRFGLQQYIEEVAFKLQPWSRAPALAAFLGQAPGFASCVYKDAN